MQDSNTNLPFKTFSVVVIVVLAAIVSLQALSAINLRNRTGLLKVTTGTTTARLSISSNNHQAEVLGGDTGSANVRLTPGSYILYAVNNGSRTSGTAVVTKGHTTDAILRFVASPGIRSVEDISFQGMGGLINAGLSSDQVSELEGDFFQYKPSANNVNIITDSISPAPYNPNTDTSITLDFAVSVDGTPLYAQATYNDLENIEVTLTNAQKQVVFNSEAVQQNGGD